MCEVWNLLVWEEAEEKVEQLLPTLRLTTPAVNIPSHRHMEDSGKVKKVHEVWAATV